MTNVVKHEAGRYSSRRTLKKDLSYMLMVMTTAAKQNVEGLLGQPKVLTGLGVPTRTSQ